MVSVFAQIFVMCYFISYCCSRSDFKKANLPFILTFNSGLTSQYYLRSICDFVTPNKNDKFYHSIKHCSVRTICCMMLCKSLKTFLLVGRRHIGAVMFERAFFLETRIFRCFLKQYLFCWGKAWMLNLAWTLGKHQVKSVREWTRFKATL